MNSNRDLSSYVARLFGLDPKKVRAEVEKYETLPRLAIVGSRRFSDRKKFERLVTENLPKLLGSETEPLYIVSGEATGIDTLAKNYAIRRGFHYLPFPYEKEFGRAGGPIRNTKIVAASTHVLAFPDSDSVGTWDTIRKAKTRGLKVLVVKV